MTREELLDRAKAFLQDRAAAYRSVFVPGTAPTKVVLADLARFCRAGASTFHENPYVAARLDGRREVWNRLQQHLKLTDEQLWQLLGGQQ